jgi:hypothetical protein
MIALELTQLELRKSKSFLEFVNFWKELYISKKEILYTQNISKTELSSIELLELFEWKNGMPLSSSKKNSFHKNIDSKLQNIINPLKSQTEISLSDFLKEFDAISPVWQIFLLHIIKPQEYPIYDQNVHRAFKYVHGLNWRNIDNQISRKEKLDFYFNQYYPFFKAHNSIRPKDFDEAFFTFGKFIKNFPYIEQIPLCET